MFFPCLGKYRNVIDVYRDTFDNAKHVSHDPLERSRRIRQAHMHGSFGPDVHLAIRAGERCLMLVFLNNGKIPEAPCKIHFGKVLTVTIDSLRGISESSRMSLEGPRGLQR